MSTVDFLAALRAAGLPLDWEDARDGLWLAAVLAGQASADEPAPRSAASGATPVARVVPPTPPAATAEANGLDPASSASGEPTFPSARSVPPTGTELFAPGASRASARRRSVPVVAPRVPLDDARIARQLRSLGRRTRVRGRPVVDEKVTVERIAETGLWHLVLADPVDRWLALDVVVHGPSMALFRRETAALVALLGRLGVFRMITTWRLEVDGDRAVVRRAVHGPVPHDPRQIADPTGRRVVLLLSDGTGPDWHSGVVDRVLADWAAAQPVALWPSLAPRLWRRTALRVQRGTLGAHRAAQPTAGYAVRFADGSTGTRSTVGVPVLSSDHGALAAWARLVAVGGSVTTAFRLLGEAVSDTTPPQTDGADPHAAITRFRMESSATAMNLAVHLSAIPLTVSTMRAAQDLMLPESRPSHLAEVFFGGLLRRVPDTAPGAEPTYDFEDGVRESLLSAISRTEARTVLDHVARGTTLPLSERSGFRALLDDPLGSGLAALDAMDRPVARVMHTVLPRLGGPYTELVRAREPTPSPPLRSEPPLEVVDPGTVGGVDRVRPATDRLTGAGTGVASMTLESAAQTLLTELGRSAYSRVRGWWKGHRTAVARSARGVAVDLKALRPIEFSGLSENDWTAACEAVADAVRRAPDLGSVSGLGGDTDAVAARLRPGLDEAELGAGARACAERLLVELCARVLGALLEEPAFPSRAVVEMMKRLEDIRARLPGGAAEAAEGPEGADPAAVFEERYRATVASAFEGLDLYGVGAMPGTAPLGMLSAWVGLAVARTDRGDARGALTGASLPAGPTLAAEERVLLRGGAGSGKSTLLRRHVLAAALNDRTWWRGTSESPVPFLIELRRFADAALPAPSSLEAVAAPALAGAVPQGWAERVLQAGRGLVLLDGLDEIPPESRDAVQHWVEDLLLAYPGTRVVVATQGASVIEGRLASDGFVSFDLQPMTRESTWTFVNLWHDAYVDALDLDEDGQELYENRRARLLEALDQRSELRSLAGVPLLCGLICLLNHHLGTSLPTRRAELYESALRLLLGGWDEQRDVRQHEEPPLDRDERRVLLERIAHGLALTERDELDREQARQQVVAETRSMGSRRRMTSLDANVLAWADEVLDWLIERSSLLREPRPGTIEFSHTSFRDYLAAREFVDRGQIDVLLHHAHRNRWHDVVAMAMSFARPAERVALLRGLLAGNDDSARDPAARQRMQLLAAVCLRESPSIVNQETGDDVRAEVLTTLRTWIPPSNREEAELLARAGTVVVDLLPGPDEIPRRQVPFVARTLAMIGGHAALSKLAGFARAGPDVFDDLLSAWRQADDPADYAGTVLAEVDFGDYRVEVRGHARIRHLMRLRGVRVLSCLGDGDPATAVAAMPQVHTLEIRNNQTLRSLDPLRHHPGLSSVALVHCDALRSIAALADTGVAELSILHCRRAELDGLAGAPLQRLVLAGERFDAGLGDLPASLPTLIELEIRNRSAPGALRGARRWTTLQRVVLGGPLSPVTLDELISLPALTEVLAADDRSVDTERARRALERRGVDVELGLTDGGTEPNPYV